MPLIFAKQNMLIKIGEIFHPVVVSVDQPIDGGDELFYCHVRFSNIKKFDAKIRGADGINCLECAIVYIKGIYRESEDPRFYLDEDEPYIDL